MTQLWRFQLMENLYKETLWCLTVNGVPAAGGHGICMAGPCPCGWEGPDAHTPAPAASMCWQRHHFWDCSVAQAVISTIQAALPAGSPPLTRTQIWLLQPPAGVHADVWPAIAALALHAMERGRRYQWATSKGQEVEDDAAQPLITDFFPQLDGQPHTQPESLSVTAGRRAVAWFWCSAQDITLTGQVPRPWISIGSQHPIFFVEGGSLRVRLPPDDASPL
jgi:hypothetical protein